MYLHARKNQKLFNQVFEIYKELEDYFESEYNSDNIENRRLKITDISSRQEQLLSSYELKDLKFLYAVSSIGHHERGYRHYYSNNIVELIDLEIRENEEELIQKHSRYITFLTKEELIDYFLSRAKLTPFLLEGMKILKLI